MARTDQAYWQRLRRDGPSSWAAGLAIVAAIAATLAAIGLLVGGAGVGRGNPLYWVLLAPLVWWASGMLGFEPRPTRLLPAVTAIAPVLAALCLALALAQERDLTPFAIAFAVALAAALGSRWAWTRSLLRREGPAR